MLHRLRALSRLLEARAMGQGLPPEEQLKRKLLVFAAALMSFATVLWLAIYWAMGVQFSATIPFAYQVATGIALSLYLARGDFRLYSNVQLSLFLFFPFGMQWSIGSYVSSSGVMLWALLAPLGAIVVQGWRESIAWFVAYLVLTALSGFFDYYLATGRQEGVPMHTIAVFFGLNFASMSVIVYILFRYFVQEREEIQSRLDREHELLLEEQAKSERLLLNILPPAIAERLKRGETTIADGHSDVTVMFADIVNFTRLTEKIPPLEMIALLNKVFSSFDALVEKHGLEKIKTIGDAYMVAGGLSGQHGTVEQVADVALEMLELFRRDPDFTRHDMGLHLGIATGPVVAGVIGIKRFIYDMWGDTVNVASRLSSEGTPNAIWVDGATRRRLEARYLLEGPTIVVLKGKGPTPLHRLVARREAAASAA
ncbi:MAG TPA: adenylate/guanylate cyclase domain-containing protein [Burkholderiales bacterium]|nr:adenylate/guanylate cyclase domain-containing protein [Burkholderiales bacterium]